MNRLAASFFAVAVAVASAAPAARADMILEQYEFQGQAGSQTTMAPSLVASGLVGVNFGEGAGNVASAGANSINSSGWNAANTFYSFGFNIAAGNRVTVDQLILTSRSSGTGPGFLNVQVSVDGAAFRTVGSFAQNGTNYNDEMLSLTAVTATRSLAFQIVAANQTSAAGGTVAGTGTFRIGDYNPPGAAAPTPFTINGTITPAAAVPEPAAVILTPLGLAVAGLVARARRRAR